MFIYEKRLLYPIEITTPNAQTAKYLLAALGGPYGEAGTALRYLHQRYAMPYRPVVALLTDIGTEELSHMELISAMIYQLTRGLSTAEIEAAGLAPYFINHTTGVFVQDAGGAFFSSQSFAVTGDPIADLFENMAAEQKERVRYENLLRLVEDAAVVAPLSFLREREIVHLQRFGEALRLVQDALSTDNYYAINPAFDL